MNTTPIHHQERNYTSAPGANYLLPSDESERARLDDQHGIVTHCFGDKLVLSPVALKGGDKVLDCGAGTGNWVLDFARTVPNDIGIYGSDIESHLFPKEHPLNVQFLNASVLDLPEDWADAFQLVHQRLLMSALTSKQWDIAIKELFRVTKPGGWVELCEAGTGVICPSYPNHKSLETYKAIYMTSDHVLDIATLLPDRLREAGFTDVESVEVNVPLGKQAGPYGERARDALVGFIMGLKTPILSRGGLGIAKSEKEYEEIVADFGRICDETSNTISKYYTIYGRKPLITGHS